MTGGRLVALVALTVIAVGVALVLQRRHPDPPSAPSYRAPAQLDRDDFTGGGQWLVVLFGSVTCDSCPVAWATVEEVLALMKPGLVGAQRVDVQVEPDLHRRYRIDGVPTTVVADPDGVVVEAFFGPMRSDELQAALVGADR